jgi:acyl-CoA thioesterase-1
MVMTGLLAAGTIKIMPLGDSITSSNKDHDSYRRPLWFKLTDAGYAGLDFVGSHNTNADGPPLHQDFDMDNEAYWGSVSWHILGNVKNTLQTIVPDIVLMHLGTNDLTCPGYDDLPVRTPQQTVNSIYKVVLALRNANPNVIILWAQIVPRSNNAIPEFNALLPAFAAEHTSAQSPLIVVDQYTGFDNTAGMDTFDGTHPNASGEEKLATNWFNALAPVLNGMATEVVPAVRRASPVSSPAHGGYYLLNGRRLPGADFRLNGGAAGMSIVKDIHAGSRGRLFVSSGVQMR